MVMPMRCTACDYGPCGMREILECEWDYRDKVIILACPVCNRQYEDTDGFYCDKCRELVCCECITNADICKRCEVIP
jgi:hypothetical protein